MAKEGHLDRHAQADWPSAKDKDILRCSRIANVMLHVFEVAHRMCAGVPKANVRPRPGHKLAYQSLQLVRQAWVALATVE